MVALPISSTLLGELALVVLIAIVLFIVFKVGRLLLKLIFGFIANSILGIVSIFLLDWLLNMGIPIKMYTIAAATVFGLPAVGTMVILRFFGVPL